MGPRFAAVFGVLVLSWAVAACAPQPTWSPLDPTPEQVVWALGDSQALLAEIVGRGPGWPARLGPAVFNGGWNGGGTGFVRPGTSTGRTIPEEAADLLDRVDSVPSHLVVMAGTNDLGSDVATIMTGVAELEQLAAANGIEVHYLSVPPFPVSGVNATVRDRRLQLNAAIATLAGARFHDCESALLDAGGVWLNPAYRLAPDDNVHLNDAGLQQVARCAATIGPPIELIE